MNLSGVSYCVVSISQGYDTLASHVLTFLLKSPQGMIPRRANLPAVSYCAEPISLGYDTLGSQCKELSIRSSNYNSFFTCIIFLAGTNQKISTAFKTCKKKKKNEFTIPCQTTTVKCWNVTGCLVLNQQIKMLSQH